MTYQSVTETYATSWLQGVYGHPGPYYYPVQTTSASIGSYHYQIVNQGEQSYVAVPVPYPYQTAASLPAYVYQYVQHIQTTANVLTGAPVWCSHETPAEAAERRAKYEAFEVERKAKRAAADTRANTLLASLLDDRQQAQLKEQDHFEIRINEKTYRITRGRQGNVQLIEGGKPVAKYCAHPDIWTPDGDAMIAQMMMLQTNEAEFLRIANRTALA